MSLESEADQLAQELFETKSRLRGAGRVLHDQVGPLLSAAGIRLALVRSDYPQAAADADQALLALEQALESVRWLSRQLNPPPGSHLGLKKALSALVEAQGECSGCEIRYSYASSLELPDGAAAAAYEAVSAVLDRAAADPTAGKLSLDVTGTRYLRIRVASRGRPFPKALLEALNRRARPAGILLECPTKKSTIVLIRHAPRRPPRG